MKSRKRATLIHQDNALVYTSVIALAKINKKLELHPPVSYSPDLAIDGSIAINRRLRVFIAEKKKSQIFSIFFVNSGTSATTLVDEIRYVSKYVK